MINGDRVGFCLYNDKVVKYRIPELGNRQFDIFVHELISPENYGGLSNIDKVLEKLKSVENRKAQFRTVICLIWNQEVFYFEGICKGTIATSMHGEEGFGYDPIFIPEGAHKSFAQMTMEEKNKYSHRQKAVTQLFTFLNSI